MPIHEYECTNCGAVIELIENEEFMKRQCPACRGEWIFTKIMSAGSFRFGRSRD